MEAEERNKDEQLSRQTRQDSLQATVLLSLGRLQTDLQSIMDCMVTLKDCLSHINSVIVAKFPSDNWSQDISAVEDVSSQDAATLTPCFDVDVSDTSLSDTSLSIPRYVLSVAKLTTPALCDCTALTPELDMEASQLDMKAPQLDMEAPQLDMEASQLDMDTPQLDMEAPQLDMEAPQLDKDAPQLDMDAPQLDKDAPQLDIEAPQLDMDTPQLDKDAPQLDKDAPQLDMNAPQLDMDAPQLDKDAPQLDKDAPQLDMDAPQLDMEAPQLDKDAPQLDMEAPQLDMEAPQLDMDASQLDKEAPQLDMEAPQLDVEEPQLNMEVPQHDMVAPEIPALAPTGILPVEMKKFPQASQDMASSHLDMMVLEISPSTSTLICPATEKVISKAPWDMAGLTSQAAPDMAVLTPDHTEVLKMTPSPSYGTRSAMEKITSKASQEMKALTPHLDVQVPETAPTSSRGMQSGKETSEATQEVKTSTPDLGIPATAPTLAEGTYSAKETSEATQEIKALTPDLGVEMPEIAPTASVGMHSAKEISEAVQDIKASTPDLDDRVLGTTPSASRGTLGPDWGCRPAVHSPDYSFIPVFVDSDDGEADPKVGVKLFKVSEKTQEFLKHSFSTAIPERTHRQWQSKFGAPNISATACPLMDGSIMERLPFSCKSKDKQIAKQQALFLDAVGPITYILEGASKGLLTHEDAIEAAQTALEFIGNASIHTSRVRRRIAMREVNRRLVDMADNDYLFTEAAPALFGNRFHKKAKEREERFKYKHQSSSKYWSISRSRGYSSSRGEELYKSQPWSNRQKKYIPDEKRRRS